MQRLITATSLGALMLLAGVASAQDTPTRTQQERREQAATSDISPDDMPAARRLIEEEAQHRDRVARIRRLRQLAQESGDRERLQQLDDLERRQVSLHDARRVRDRASMSDRGRASTDDFLRRGGTMRARVAAKQTERERAAMHKEAREKAAAKQQRREAAAKPDRSPSRSPRSSGGGRSPR